MDVDGVVTHVRDEFEMIDDDSFRNRTSICQSNKQEWRVVSENTYSRIASEG